VYSKILILRFPKTEVKKPLVCYLARDYDLVFNILNAGILPRKEGYMVLELTGTRKNFKDGVKYLKSQGVSVQNASQEISAMRRYAPTAVPAQRSVPRGPWRCSGRKWRSISTSRNAVSASCVSPRARREPWTCVRPTSFFLNEWSHRHCRLRRR
jgi:hypothetical protein